MLEKAKDLFLNSKTVIFTLMLITAVGITVTGFVYKQDFFKILPLYIALVAKMLSSKGLRIAPLINGINCILLTLVSFSYGLYASALSTLLVECPIQIMTFLLWSRNKFGASTYFRKLKAKWRISILIFLTLLYILTLFANRAAGGAYILLDTLQAVLALATPFLLMFAFVEYTYTLCLSCITTLSLYILMLAEQPELASYVVISIYSLICAIRGLFNVALLDKQQNGADAKKSS